MTNDAGRGEIEELLPLSPRDFHILFALADGEMHGYGLVKAIERQTDGLIRLDPANLYRAVQKMVDDGLVEDADRKPAPGSADERRRYYRITGMGRELVGAEAVRMRGLARQAEAKSLIPKPDSR